MNSSNNETPLPQVGNPLDHLHPATEVKQETPPPATAKTHTTGQLREGDSGIGTPRPQSKEIRVIPKKESQEFKDKQAEKEREQLNELFKDLLESDGWALPKPLKNAATLILLVISAVLGIYTVTQSVTFLQTLSTLPTWAQITTSLCMLTFGLIIAYVLLQLTSALLILKENPRINNGAIKKLRERQCLQLVASRHQTEAKSELEIYLTDYQWNRKTLNKFQAMGMKAKEWETLEQIKEELTHPNHPMAACDWLKKFEKDFQAILVACAERRVRVYSRRIGIGTAASPIPLVDRIITLYGTLSMIKELCLLFNLRPAYGQSITILSQSIIQTYLSGIAQEGMESSVESGMDFYSEIAAKNATDAANISTEGAADAATDAASNAGDTSVDLAGATTGALLGKVGAKASEGALNALLVYRLGNQTIKILKPIK